MYCRKCGKEIESNEEYCGACKIEIEEKATVQEERDKTNLNISKKLCCPKCKSRNIQIVTNTQYHTETKGGGYSASKGCCGYMILGGPLGLLCGACGNKSKTTVTSTTTNAWVCHDCGNKFRDIADIDLDIKGKTRMRKALPVVLYVLGAFYLVFPVLYLFVLGRIEIFEILLGLFVLVLGKVVSVFLDNQISALQEEKKSIEENGYING